MEPLCIVLRWHTLSPKTQMIAQDDAHAWLQFWKRVDIFYREIFEYLRGAKLARTTTNSIKKYSVLNSAPRQQIM